MKKGRKVKNREKVTSKNSKKFYKEMALKMLDDPYGSRESKHNAEQELSDNEWEGVHRGLKKTIEKRSQSLKGSMKKWKADRKNQTDEEAKKTLKKFKDHNLKTYKLKRLYQDESSSEEYDDMKARQYERKSKRKGV